MLFRSRQGSGSGRRGTGVHLQARNLPENKRTPEENINNKQHMASVQMQSSMMTCQD